jgi:Low affinity iron permease
MGAFAQPGQSLNEHKGAPRVSRHPPRVSRHPIQPFRYVGLADRVTPRHLGCRRPYPPTLGYYWPDTLVQQYLAIGREYRHDHHNIPHGLIQSTQNKDSIALQLKLDELIRAISGARNRLLEVDGLPVVHQRHLPQGSLPGIHNPARGGHRRIGTSLIHPAAWKGCSPRLVCTIVHASPCGGA